MAPLQIVYFCRKWHQQFKKSCFLQKWAHETTKYFFIIQGTHEFLEEEFQKTRLFLDHPSPQPSLKQTNFSKLKPNVFKLQQLKAIFLSHAYFIQFTICKDKTG